MGTIIVNGKRFAGNSVAVRDGKVVIDGKVQDGELHGDVDVQAIEGDSARAECVAYVGGAAVRGDGLARAAASANVRAGGGIRAAAIASTDNGSRKRRKR